MALYLAIQSLALAYALYKLLTIETYGRFGDVFVGILGSGNTIYIRKGLYHPDDTVSMMRANGYYEIRKFNSGGCDG